MLFAKLALAVILYVWAFFAFYVLVMGLYRAELAGRLSSPVRVLGMPWLGVGYVMDIVANLTIAWALFLDLPREFLVTARLQRYMRAGPSGGWRYKLAVWICFTLLDPFDPRGKHC